MTPLWQSRPPSNFLAVGMRPSNTVFIQRLWPDKSVRNFFSTRVVLRCCMWINPNPCICGSKQRVTYATSYHLCIYGCVLNLVIIIQNSFKEMRLKCSTIYWGCFLIQFVFSLRDICYSNWKPPWQTQRFRETPGSPVLELVIQYPANLLFCDKC